MIIVDKLNNVLDKSWSIRGLSGLAEDSKGARVIAKGPAAKGDDLLDSRHPLEDVELRLNTGGINSEVRHDIDKGKMDMGVSILVNLIHIHMQTLAVAIEGFKISHVDLLSWRGTFDDVHAAIENTYSCAVSGN